MYSYINKNNELISIPLETLLSIVNSNKNLISLSIQLNTTVETARSILEDLEKMNGSSFYRLEQYKRWPYEEDKQLEEEYKNNMSIKQISEIHGRTTGAIISRLKHKNLYITNTETTNVETTNTETTNITPKEKDINSGMFRIRFIGDNCDEVYFYNIQEKENNIDPTRPIFEELFKTEIGEINDKYSFIMLDKSQYIPEKQEEKIEEEKPFDKKRIYYLKIYHLTEYIPKWCNRNDENSTRILDLKNRYLYAINYYYDLTLKWLIDNSLLSEDVMIAVVPSHEANEVNVSGTADIAKMIINNSNMQDGINLVLRKTTIQKKSTSMFKPTLNQDINSLEINENIDFKGKIIVILDDVTTHGDSFKAAAYHLLMNGAKDVIPLAMGKTVIPNE
jgi:hypothetical protein